MGAFIETQQAILSEEKQKRLEREEKQRIKKKQEEAERTLYFKFDTILQNKWCQYFTAKTTAEAYKELIKIKDNLIFNISKNENIQYYLDRKYLKILNETYKKYQAISTIDKQKQKDDEEEAERKLHKIFKGSFDFLQVNNRFGSHYFKTYFEVYNFLLKPTTQNQIISCITQNQDTIYILNQKYITILNNTYKQYKLLINQATPKTTQQKQTTQKTELTNTQKAAIASGAVLWEAVKITAIVILTPLAFITSLIVHKR